MSRLMGKPTMWLSNRSDTNRSVQAQKRARSLKLRSYVEEELYYPSSENKGADQLRGYREADLRLCFRLCRLLVFPWGGSYITVYLLWCRLMNTCAHINIMKSVINKRYDSKCQMVSDIRSHLNRCIVLK